MPATSTILITGATDGLGRALAGELSTRADTRLILHGRSAERLATLEAELADQPAQITTVRADFAELAQVRALAEEITGLTEQLSVLVNNAGVWVEGARELTVDGNELTFGVNYLAAFALTQRLVPVLAAAAPARIVHVASLGQAPIDFDDLTLEHGYSGQRAYGQSKLAMITHAGTLAEQLDPGRVTVNSLHPGTYMPTKMVLDNVGHSVDSLETGVLSTLRLIEAPELTGVTGRFFDRTRDARAQPDAYDPAIRDRLWSISRELTAT